jgi:hypothetical protein
MSEIDPETPRVIQLPTDLEHSLQQATAQSAASLVALRRTLRRHVRAERSSGISLVDIERGIRAMLARADTRSRDAAKPGHTPGTLSAQIFEWSEAFFRQSD